MSIYNYLLLAVPVVGIIGIMVALHFTPVSGPKHHLHPGE